MQVREHKSNCNSCLVVKNLKRKHQLDRYFNPFTPALTKNAILKSSNSVALGPDGLTSLHLKYLGPKEISYVTDLYNLFLNKADLQTVCKQANIIPIPKLGKPIDQSKSYRPISLLSPAIKVQEHLLLPYISESLSCAPTQHGYRPMLSTTTALLPIATNIAIGFNEPKPAKRTALMSIDISSALDAVDHDLLLGKNTAMLLHSNVTRWMAAYLCGRTAVCLSQGAVSHQHTCHSGVPQRSVILSHLINFFVSDFSSHAQVNESYADDFSLSESSSDVDALGPFLTSHLSVISKWAKDNKLEFSAAKSHVTLFTPHTKEVNRDTVVTIDGV
jgi:hypothetical protein